MKPNTNYGVRPVKAAEIAEACGSARRAVEITGGDEATALFYLNNRDLIPAAGPAKNHCLSEFASDLRALRDIQEEAKRQAEREALETERRRKASEAWQARGSVAAVMRACGAGRDTAKKLIQDVQHA